MCAAPRHSISSGSRNVFRRAPPLVDLHKSSDLHKRIQLQQVCEKPVINKFSDIQFKKASTSINKFLFSSKILRPLKQYAKEIVPFTVQDDISESENNNNSSEPKT